jgi:hypothetical protein
MMRVDIMMSLIFRCRHHDESEHNDGRVSPLVNKGEPHFANTIFVETKTLNCSPTPIIIIAIISVVNRLLAGPRTDVSSTYQKLSIC